MPNRRAYLKPLRPGKYPTAGVAAREKIASDLAYDLDIPVPPVVLHQRAERLEGEEEHCCISLICYPRQFHWGFLLKSFRDPFVQALREPINTHLPVASARALVFDTWVLQNDHDHESNCAFGYDFREMTNRGFIFFDFAYALAFAAPLGEMPRYFTDYGEVRFPKEMKNSLDKQTISHTIDRIEAYDDERIQQVVGRIPEGYLDATSRAHIAAGLITRRGKLRAILGAYL